MHTAVEHNIRSGRFACRWQLLADLRAGQEFATDRERVLEANVVIYGLALVKDQDPWGAGVCCRVTGTEEEMRRLIGYRLPPGTFDVYFHDQYQIVALERDLKFGREKGALLQLVALGR